MTYDDLQDMLPFAAIELVGDREELVIYTGLSVPDGSEPWGERELVPMDEEA